MDNKTRIEKDGADYANKIVHPDTPCGESLREYAVKDYIAGATAEQERSEKWKKTILDQIHDLQRNIWDSPAYQALQTVKELIEIIENERVTSK